MSHEDGHVTDADADAKTHTKACMARNIPCMKGHTIANMILPAFLVGWKTYDLGGRNRSLDLS